MAPDCACSSCAGQLVPFLLYALDALGWAPVSHTSAAKTNVSFDRNVLGAVSLAFAMHLLNFLIVYFFARALGTSITYLQVFVMIPVVAFLVMLPITINGHGLREVLLIGYFTQMGLAPEGRPVSGPREVAVALSLLLIANDLLWSLPGGIWYLTRFRGSPPSTV